MKQDTQPVSATGLWSHVDTITNIAGFWADVPGGLHMHAQQSATITTAGAFDNSLVMLS